MLLELFLNKVLLEKQILYPVALPVGIGGIHIIVVPEGGHHRWKDDEAANLYSAGVDRVAVLQQLTGRNRRAHGCTRVLRRGRRQRGAGYGQSSDGDNRSIRDSLASQCSSLFSEPGTQIPICPSQT